MLQDRRFLLRKDSNVAALGMSLCDTAAARPILRFAKKIDVGAGGGT